jgi:glycosyltransferase involved in cell wall biosynthesis
VAVESGAIAEIIQHKENGFLTSKVPAEIANQISELFSNSAIRLAAGQSALKSSAISGQVKKMAPAHIQVYKNLLIRNN